MADHNPLFIIDASVLIKWAISEVPNLDQALSLREDVLQERIDGAIPTHCLIEVCNILGRKFPDIALSFLSFLITSGIEEKHFNLDIANVSFQLMNKYKGITFYDANYHALAIREGGTFVTADVKYFQKAKKEGHIMLLKDYGKKR